MKIIAREGDGRHFLHRRMSNGFNVKVSIDTLEEWKDGIVVVIAKPSGAFCHCEAAGEADQPKQSQKLYLWDENYLLDFVIAKRDCFVGLRPPRNDDE